MMKKIAAIMLTAKAFYVGNYWSVLVFIKLGDTIWTKEQCLSFGNKAVNLHSLICNSFDVPDGFCISNATQEDIKFIWQRLEDFIPLAVRSSMSNEDGENVSNAGRYNSVIGVCTYGGLTNAITEVLNCKEDGGAVIVQPCVAADVSGVVFSSVSAEDDHCVIEATFGLGEILVAGVCVPDRYIVQDGVIVEKNISKTKTIGLHIVEDTATIGDQIFAHPNSRIVINSGRKAIVSYNPVQKRTACLSDESIVELSKIAKSIEGFFNHPQDIEFAYCNERGFVILQSRPITKSFLHGQYMGRNKGLNHNYTKNDILFGVGASAGVSRGRAITEETETIDDEGLILVMDQLEPQLLYKCANRIQGIVCASGSVLCHAAIFARENGIPCVVAIGESIRMIEDGNVLEIDGETGSVRIIEG